MHGVTWEDKDEAGCESSNQWDHTPDVGGEEREDEGDDEPHHRLQDPPPALTPHAHLHLLASETQPKSLYDGSAASHDHTWLSWRKAPQTVEQ